MAEIEMTDFDEPEVEDRPVIEETSIDLPDIPLDTKSVEELQTEAKVETLVDSIRKNLGLHGRFDQNVYKLLTIDKEGYLYYDHKRLTSKRGNKFGLLSIKTLQNRREGREFLRMIGYDSDATQVKTRERDLDTVAPQLARAIKAKIDSFKATEEWAKKEKEKAARELETTTDQSERQTLQEAFSYFDHMELQAKRRYNEITSSQLQRVNEIINDRSRSLGERLKELFRRDGVTIGAIITAIGMTISTIILSISSAASGPTPNPGPPPPTPKPNIVRRILVKVANLLLDLAKKALAALPGALGSLIGLLFRKAGQAVLFLSEHLVILFLAVILAATEFIIRRRNKTL